MTLVSDLPLLILQEEVLVIVAPELVPQLNRPLHENTVADLFRTDVQETLRVLQERVPVGTHRPGTTLQPLFQAWRSRCRSARGGPCGRVAWVCCP